MNDCVHDWRLERIGENSETGSWQARCKECNGIDSPGVMNEQADIRQDEIDLMVDMLDCFAEQIEDLTAENGALSRRLAGSQAALSKALAELTAARAELVARDAQACATCALYPHCDVQTKAYFQFRATKDEFSCVRYWQARAQP